MALALVCFVTLPSTATMAKGLYVEPYFGYESGELDYGSTDDDTKGVVYGAKLGYMSGSVGMGFYYGTGSVEVDSTIEDDFEIEDKGAYLIYKFNTTRLWATYIFDATGELDDAGTKYKDGTGQAFGVGFKVLNGLSLNIEKISRKYKKVDNNPVTPKRELSALVFSLSIPYPQ